MNAFRRSLLAVALAATSLPAARAAAAAPAVPAAPQSAAQLSDAKLRYILTVGDRLRVVVTGQSDLNKDATITSTGSITLSLITEIRIAGLTVAQAQEAIAKAYIDQRFLRHPEVIISIEQAAAKYVYIGGEVNRKEPILYPTDTGRPMKLLEVLLKAGYTGEAQLKSVTVARENPDGSRVRLGPFDMDAVIRGRSSEGNIDLQPGDNINVPQRTF